MTAIERTYYAKLLTYAADHAPIEKDAAVTATGISSDDFDKYAAHLFSRDQQGKYFLQASVVPTMLQFVAVREARSHANWAIRIGVVAMVVSVAVAAAQFVNGARPEDAPGDGAVAAGATEAAIEQLEETIGKAVGILERIEEKLASLERIEQTLKAGQRPPPSPTPEKTPLAAK